MVRSTSADSLAFAADAGATHRRIAAGVALSLLLHVLVLGMQRGSVQREPAAAPRPLAVRLRPPPAPRVEAAPPPAAPAAQPARRVRKTARPVIAVDPAPTPAQPDPFTVEQTPQAAPESESESEPETPRFDREGARRMARSLANIRDPAKEGTAIGQFPDPPLKTETRAARAIGAAKRRNCKDGIPGGLLAPLILLADKKDSGCKW
ncbi:hypothetical protein [Massilia sp. Leaf139]|uniref:hypothetical protein n=1 Tax=Massilia sp. Leaf139 TaxID=1736272 RepID=UPI0007010CED|nr:hypothetical protein [Massilia sp. Leaf139]KQQ88479.1 hypothetical protein ASF77_12500 [Massilia sp. Leaf139]